MKKQKTATSATTTEDKLATGCMSGFGVLACGPCLFVLIFALVALLIALPLSLVGLGTPDWLIAIMAVIALVITVALIVTIAAEKVKESREDALIRKAEVKRAKEELEDK